MRHFASQRIPIRLAALGLVALLPFFWDSSAFADRGGVSVDTDFGYNSGLKGTIPVDPGSVNLRGNQPSNESVDQSMYGNACATGGVNDGSTTCGVTATPQQDRGDNDPCLKSPGDPACQTPKPDETARPSCGPNAYLRGGAGSTSFLCVCKHGGTPPNCTAAEGEQQDPYAACRQETLAYASQCSAGHSSASSSCSQNRVDGAVSGAQSDSIQRMNQGTQNYADNCSRIANGYTQASNQLTSIQGSCQSAVQQCASACQQMMNVAQRCPDPTAQRRAQSLASAHQSCSGGELARRPGEIGTTSRSLAQTGAGEASQCNQQTSASSQPTGGANAASGGGEQPKGTTQLAAGASPGSGGDVSGRFDHQLGTNPTPSSLKGRADTSGGASVDEEYNVSGALPTTEYNGSSAGAGGNPLLALPGTPIHVENTEETQPASGAAADAATVTAGLAGGGRGGARMFLPRRVGEAASMTDGPMKASEKAGEETPDLNAFLPGARGPSGFVAAGLSGCRIPDPAKPKECAVPHGPTMNIWSKMKERFELLRNAPPPSDYFFNEE
ncbi:MAG: hypothetical protein KF789_08775 [Bdellovibrionaceae bacterium]|nr:hypothetical protein [Pseudobdellovibrionaceae bacterium]